jgi:hypothetical protein
MGYPAIPLRNFLKQSRNKWKVIQSIKKK